jgi:hypothetical protein
MRNQIEIIVFGAAAIAAGYGGSLLCANGHLNPLIANIPAIGVIALFARRHRHDDILVFVLVSIGIAYCGFLGLVMAVVPTMTITPPHSVEALGVGVAGPLRNRLPIVFFAGIPYALVLSLAIALPVSKLRFRAAPTPNRDDPMWQAIHERAVSRAHAPKRPGPDVEG